MPKVELHVCACSECACPAIVSDDEDTCDSCAIGLHGGPDIW